MAKQSTIARRATVVALKAYTPKSSAEIAALTDLSVPSVNRIYAEAIKRGFDPHRTMVDNQYVEDKPRSGRPTKQDPSTVDIILSKVRLDRYGREKTCADIAGDLSKLGINISGATVYRVLKNAGFRKTKPTRKPGLTKKMRAERLAWCLAHESWTLEDWKNVIFSDETSVILLHRRGGYRIWRTKDERFLRSCIRERWKGASEFMFWGCFSYNKKGPYHCWLPETAQEKRDAEKEIERLNNEIEPTLRTAWEIETGVRRLNLRQNPSGRKPTWKFTAKTGKLGRGKRGGIDWYRYQRLILLPKLLPFAQECAIERPGTLVQEDKAPAHNHYIQQRVFDTAQVQRLLWCPNSPDLNAIEPTWPWMKRRTTRKGAPKTRQEAFSAWKAAWQELPQERIQQWIERIPWHIKQIIELEGGNEYKEGREKQQGDWEDV
jgi:transposase